MSLFKQLAKLWYILPVAIISIVILDLVRNRSLVTQYLHWTVYAVVGTTAAIFTGQCLAVSRTVKKSSRSSSSWISQFILSSLQKPYSRPQVSDQTTIDYEVRRLTLIIVQNYIDPWAQELQSNISQEISQEIEAFLLLLCHKLDSLEGIVVFTEALTLLRRHLRKKPSRHRKAVSREKHVETALKQLLLAWGMQLKLTSDLVFIVVNKILTSQVILRFVDYASNPNTIEAYINTFFHGQTSLADTSLFQHSASKDNYTVDSPTFLNCELKTEDDVEPKIMKDETTNLAKKSSPFFKTKEVVSDVSPIPQATGGSKDNAELKESALDAGSKISNALGTLFSGTAGPLLPGNTAFQSFNNLWQSPSTESLSLPYETSSTTQDSGKSCLQSTLRRLSIQHEPLIYNPFWVKKPQRKKSNSLDLGKAVPRMGFTLKTQTFDFIHDSEEEEDSLNYEDNEDLESTISKLRQLLADKDSTSSSTEGFIKIEYVNADEAFVIKIEESGILSRKKISEFLELKSKIDPDSKVAWEKTSELSGYEMAELLEKWMQDPLVASHLETKAFLEPSEEKKKKGLAKKMTGMLNSIKDVFPTFEDEPQHQESSDSSHFLLPPMFTPSPSPSKESLELPNSSKPKKLTFNFVTNTNEKSELEATLDFHVQHWKYLPTEGEDTVDHFRKQKQSFNDYILDIPDEPNLAALTIKMIMVDIPKFLFDGQECLDNAILYNFALVTFGDVIQKHLEESLAQDWIHMGLQKISSFLRPQKNCNSYPYVISDNIKNPIETLLQLCGSSWEQMVEKLKSLTLDQTVNEDFLLDLFDLIVTKLLIKETT